MKRNQNNTNGSRPHGARGFTLIEMIGVLAVIAILAALLIPKVFNAINDARVNGTCVSIETVKTALADHYGKAGRFDLTTAGTPIANFAPSIATPFTGYDTNVLVPEALLDKGFLPKIGTNATVQVRPCALGTVLPNGGANAAYSLSGASTNEATGQYVLEAVIYGVAESDAQALSARIDGPALSTTTIGTTDSGGRVQYVPNGSGGTTTVYIYLAHR